MVFKITGRVFEAESGTGVEYLLVKAVDKDLFYDDLVGERKTAANGSFEILYEERDFKELFEKKPDLYVVVKTPDHTRTLYSSKDKVRCEANVHEHFDIAIPKSVLGDLAPSPTPRYGTKPGRFVTRLLDSDGKTISGRKVLIITEHKPNDKRQSRIITEDADLQVELQPGTYSYQIYVKGYDIVRGAVKIQPGKIKDFAPSLKPAEKPPGPKPLKERLMTYGLDADKLKIQSLNLKSDEHLNLNYKKHKDSRNFSVLETTTIADLKRWVGTPDSCFRHDLPIFGQLPQLSKTVLSDEPLSSRLSATDRADLSKVANEYIHGNSLSVQQFEPVINGYLKVIGQALVPVFFYNVVTIENGAVLEVGNGSSVFVADLVRIHTNGHFNIVGPCRVDVGKFEVFS